MFSLETHLRQGESVRSKSEDKELPTCSHCGLPMRFVRTIGTVGLADIHAFQCDPCSLLLTGEAVAEAQKMADAGHRHAKKVSGSSVLQP